VRTRLLFLAVFTPLGVLGRPFWRRRLGLSLAPRASSYWRRRRNMPVSDDDLRRLT
jgi:hypothetical protein